MQEVAAKRRHGDTDDADEIEASAEEVHALSVEFRAALPDVGHDPDLAVAASFHSRARSELHASVVSEATGAVGDAMWMALHDVTTPDQAQTLLNAH